MKFYKRDPDRALAGMAALSAEQRGAYNSLIDLLYSRDGVVRDDDQEVAHAVALDRRLWNRLKTELMAAGKVRVREGFLRANGVAETIDQAQLLSSSQRARVQLRWNRVKSANEINEAEIRRRNTIQYTDIKKEADEAVDNVDKSQAEQADQAEQAEAKNEKPRHPLSSSPELERVMRFKERWT
jgi:hypothetical protein